MANLDIKSYNNNSFTLKADSLPSGSETYRLKVVATSETGKQVTATKDIVIASTAVDKITVTQASNMLKTANTAYGVTLDFSSSTGRTPNITVKSLSVTTSEATSIVAVSKVNVATTGLGGSFELTRKSLTKGLSTTVTVTAILTDGNQVNTQFSIDTSVKPTVTINESAITATLGEGTFPFTFSYSPTEHNSTVAIKTVSTNNTAMTIDSDTISNNGFTAKVSGLTATSTITISVVVSINGTESTITKSVTVTYRKIYSKFKVYYEHVCIAPVDASQGLVILDKDYSESTWDASSGVVPVYVGQGYWQCADTVDDGAKVYKVGDLTDGKYAIEYLGTYGDEIVVDKDFIRNYTTSIWANSVSDSSITYTNTFSQGSSNYKCLIYFSIANDVVESWKGYRITLSITDTSTKKVYTKTYIIDESYNRSPLASNKEVCEKYVAWTEIGSSWSYTVTISKDGEEITTTPTSSWTVYYGYISPSIYTPSAKSDLAIKSTSFTAGNGTIDSKVEWTSASGATVAFLTAATTGVVESKLSNNEIALSGTVAADTTTNSTLSVTYRIGNTTYYSDYSGSYTLTIKYVEVASLKLVDLGLPSGLMWANINIGASNDTEAGEYFQWGGTTGHAAGEGYNFSSSNYPESTLTSDITEDSGYDTARVNLGSPWRMPTSAEFKELLNTAYVTRQWTTKNGVYGYLFTSIANGNTIFMPVTGCYDGSSLYDATSDGYYWSSSYGDSSSAYYLYFNSSYCNMYNYGRCCGRSVRGVCKVDLVDLGLPSGLKWMKCNLGAEKETDYGLYYQWGGTKGYSASDGYNFSSSNYPESSLSTSITDDNRVKYDAVQAIYGQGFTLPTKADFEELYNNTTHSWTTIDGVYGRKFVSKTDDTKYIFLPAAGYYNGTSLYGATSGGFYWSSTYGYSSSAYSLCFNSSYCGMNYYDRYCGRSVRGVCRG